jgi:hypothetical protein
MRPCRCLGVIPKWQAGLLPHGPLLLINIWAARRVSCRGRARSLLKVRANDEEPVSAPDALHKASFHDRDVEAVRDLDCQVV